MKTQNLTFRNWKTFAVLMLCSSFIFSCSKEDDNPTPDPGNGNDTTQTDPNGDENQPTKDTIVHVLGLENDGTNQDIKIWINGADSVKSVGSIPAQNVNVEDAVLYDGDLYAVGTKFDGSKNVATLWKNGDPTALGVGTENSSAVALAIDNDGIVYVAGEGKGPIGFTMAQLWTIQTNATVTLDTLFNENMNAYVGDITLADGDIYVAGNVHGGIGTYWVNGDSVEVNDLSMISAIQVKDGKMYLAGKDYNDNELRYIADGTTHTLTSNNGEITGMVVNDDDVYITGNEKKAGDSRYSAVYWKNGDANYLTDGTKSAMADAMTLFDGDVYVSGYEKAGSGHQTSSIAKYWINDSAHEVALTDGTNNANTGIIFVSVE